MSSLCDALILGGGLGTRFASEAAEQTPKQFLCIGDAPVFVHAVRGLMRAQCLRRFVLVFPEPWIEEASRIVQRSFSTEERRSIDIIAGGGRRQESSWRGLTALANQPVPPSRVLIHDACRPYLSPEMIDRIARCLSDRSYAAWIPAVAVSETLKRVKSRQVVETVSREGMFRVQTPQIFEFEVIRSLTERSLASPEIEFTDDASICEHYGIPVGVIEGDVRNIKLTYGWELEILRALLGSSTGT